MPSPLEYLRHILEEAAYLTAAASQLTEEAFARNETMKRAFVRSLEVIGEAAKKVPPDFRQRYAHIEVQARALGRERGRRRGRRSDLRFRRLSRPPAAGILRAGDLAAGTRDKRRPGPAHSKGRQSARHPACRWSRSLEATRCDSLHRSRSGSHGGSPARHHA